MTNEQQKNLLIHVASGAIGGALATILLAVTAVTIFPNQIRNALRIEAMPPENVLADANRQPSVEARSTIPSMVKRVSPAVVAIVLKKDVPVYKETFNADPFEDFFGDMFGSPMRQREQTGTEKVEVGGGTGFLISKDGYIVTNRHVVEQTDVEYSVMMDDGTSHDAKVIAKDPTFDIAVIKIEGDDYPFLAFGDSDKIEVGQSAIAIGNALAEFRNTVSVGVISGLSRSITAGDGIGGEERLDGVIQTDAAINPGNSGGPLLDLDGNVIGVNVATAGAENIGFALPANMVQKVAAAVQKDGKISRPYLGIRYMPIDEDLQKRNALNVDYGVLVIRGETMADLAIVPGSPADKAGILENDIVLTIDGEKIDDTHGLAMLLRKKNIGDTVKLTILRKGEEKTVDVKLEAFPEE
jgi:serine protease Do